MCENCDNFVKKWEKKHKGEKIADECKCDSEDREIVDVIHKGNFKELFEYCENCGGVI
jgi:hypothetical protein